MSKTVGEWQDRKVAQGERFLKLDPSLVMECWQDYGTRFALIHHGLGTALVFGCLRWAETGQHAVDLTDEQIGQWAAPLRGAKECQSPV